MNKKLKNIWRMKTEELAVEIFSENCFKGDLWVKILQSELCVWNQYWVENGFYRVHLNFGKIKDEKNLNWVFKVHFWSDFIFKRTQKIGVFIIIYRQVTCFGGIGCLLEVFSVIFSKFFVSLDEKKMQNWCFVMVKGLQDKFSWSKIIFLVFLVI